MLRDLLLRLAVTDLYRARWSADIHDEWMRSLAANRPDIPPEHITRVRNLMDENVRDALVEDYASLVLGLTLPDPKDRHVLAAAIVGRADVIVTFNLREFPADLPSASRLSTRTNSCATSSTWRRIWSARSCANFAPASGIRRAQSTHISPPSRSTTSSTSPRHSARGWPQSDHGNLRQVGPTFGPGPLQEYACTAHSPQPAGPAAQIRPSEPPLEHTLVDRRDAGNEIESTVPARARTRSIRPLACMANESQRAIATHC